MQRANPCHRHHVIALLDQLYRTKQYKGHDPTDSGESGKETWGYPGHLSVHRVQGGTNLSRHHKGLQSRIEGYGISFTLGPKVGHDRTVLYLDCGVVWVLWVLKLRPAAIALDY